MKINKLLLSVVFVFMIFKLNAADLNDISTGSEPKLTVTASLIDKALPDAPSSSTQRSVGNGIVRHWNPSVMQIKNVLKAF